MKIFLRLLTYAKPYWAIVIIALVASILFGLFNKVDLAKAAKNLRFKKVELRVSKYFRMDETKVTLKAFMATLGITYTFK